MTCRNKSTGCYFARFQFLLLDFIFLVELAAFNSSQAFGNRFQTGFRVGYGVEAINLQKVEKRLILFDCCL